MRLDFLKEERIDLICTYPPYADTIHYSDSIEGGVSYLDTESFLVMMEEVAQEPYRVLKKGKICAAMVGDTRKKGQMISLGFRTMEYFTRCGFQLEEIVLKEQHDCKSTKT